MNRSVLHLVFIAAVVPLTYGQNARSVIDNELGTIFSDPNGFSYSDIGARVGEAHDVPQFSSMDPQALKVSQSRFHVLKPSDDTTWNYFPYTSLRNFEASEVAAGRPPIFVTATYAGKKRPVLWNWSLSLNSNNVPTASSNNWEYAVNVGDDRYIKFWLNQYARSILLPPLKGLQNQWIGLDECAFTLPLYGVLDDSGKFVSGVQWDSPFPQNETDYYKSVDHFFTRALQLAPDLKLMPNSGSIGDWTQYSFVYESVPGIMTEEIYFPTSTAYYARDKVYNQYTAYSWGSSQGKAMIFRSDVTNSPSYVQSSFLAYLLLKGNNTFYAPRIVGTSQSLPPSQYTALSSTLGNPSGALQSQQQSGSPSVGYRLYSRQYQGGIVYMNMTGSSQTVTLPTGTQYYDANGTKISTLVIPDLSAGYALLRSGGAPTSIMPRINPRFSTTVTGPLSVKITDSATSPVIYYTLSGTPAAPGSPVYTAPMSLPDDTIVSTVGSQTGQLTSFNNQRLYRITSTPPEIQFLNPSETWLSGTYYPVLSLTNVSATNASVTYTVRPQSGQVSSGTVTFKPGDIYATFPINVSSSATITLSSPQGAFLGPNNTFTYTRY